MEKETDENIRNINLLMKKWVCSKCNVNMITALCETNKELIEESVWENGSVIYGKCNKK